MSKFCKYPTKENLNNVRLFRAKARRTIKSAKRKSWRTYILKLIYRTPIKKVWDMVRKISGKSKSANYKHLNTNFNNTEAKATSKKDIADTLGSTSLKNTSNRNYCEKFQTYMCDQQKFYLNF